MKIINLILKNTKMPRTTNASEKSGQQHLCFHPTSSLHQILLFPTYNPNVKHRKNWTSLPVLSGDDLPSSRGLVFTAVTVVTTVPQGITVRSFSILVLDTGEETCQVFNSLGSIKKN